MLIPSILVILLSYALGCFAFGYYLVRWRTGGDLRQIGSGATGGRNASRALGASGAVITALGDVLKGALAMAIALRFKLDLWAIAFVMIAVLAGHIWPLQLGFKGGKGLSPALGAILMFDYRVALLAVAIAVLLFLISRRNELFFLIGVASTPITAFFLGHEREIVAGMVAVIVIIWYAHRANIRESLRKLRQPHRQTSQKGE